MRIFTIVALAVAIGLGTALPPFASSSPDGLTKVSERTAFAEQGRLPAVQEKAPVPGYAFPGVRDDRVAKGLAGFAGTLGVFLVGYGIAAVVRPRPTGVQAA